SEAGVILKGLTPGEPPDFTPSLSIEAEGVSVHGFTIQTVTVTDDDLYATMIHVHATNVEIYDNNFQISSGTVKKISEVVGVVTDDDVSGLYIHDNNFTASGTGNKIDLQAIYINPQTGLGPITIESNTIGGALKRGIATERSNTIITGNSISSTLPPGGLGTEKIGDAWCGIAIGIWYQTISIGTIEITDNIVNDYKFGIELGRDGVTITSTVLTGNTLEDNAKGIHVVTSADEIEIHQNNIYDEV
ncbi:unnamed protein product, partial [marine sediment metagenome]